MGLERTTRNHRYDREARLAHPNGAPHFSLLIPKVSLAFAFMLVVMGWAFK